MSLGETASNITLTHRDNGLGLKCPKCLLLEVREGMSNAGITFSHAAEVTLFMCVPLGQDLVPYLPIGLFLLFFGGWGSSPFTIV